MSELVQLRWQDKYFAALEREQAGLRRERALRDAIRWHEQSRGTSADRVDHELYRTEAQL